MGFLQLVQQSKHLQIVFSMMHSIKYSWKTQHAVTSVLINILEKIKQEPFSPLFQCKTR